MNMFNMFTPLKMRNELDAPQVEHNRLLNENIELSKQIELIDNDNKRLRSELDLMKSDLFKVREENFALQAEVTRLKSNQNDYEQMKVDIDRLRTELEMKKFELDVADKRMKHAQLALESVCEQKYEKMDNDAMLCVVYSALKKYFKMGEDELISNEKPFSSNLQMNITTQQQQQQQHQQQHSQQQQQQNHQQHQQTQKTQVVNSDQLVTQIDPIINSNTNSNSSTIISNTNSSNTQGTSGHKLSADGKRKRGRPFGSYGPKRLLMLNTPEHESAKRKRGRPFGSYGIKRLLSQNCPDQMKRGRGRPMGSLNKKTILDQIINSKKVDDQPDNMKRGPGRPFANFAEKRMFMDHHSHALLNQVMN